MGVRSRKSDREIKETSSFPILGFAFGERSVA